ncbi:C-signal-like isoform X1 [Rhineura floridana]|uniref:C-signal-like isoform X1 n=1 Tax=Rhineura floridana TaxID=261503 RepID=UPI002AC810B9|nr:C-signal-like isoform X1 [Rhineura floridana]
MKRCFLKHILQAGRKRDPEAPTPRGRMATDFTVQSVLVTGSSKGIGLGLVKQFLMLPTPPQWVFATTNQDMDGPKNKEVKELASLHQNLVLLHLDVTDLKSIKAAVEQVQKYVGECGLNLLMNNAGIHLESTLETENAKDMAAEYAINTVGPLQVSQAFLPLLKMAAQRSPQEGLSCSKAAIINTSSAGGSIEVVLLWNVMPDVGYRCSKAALNMLTKCQSLAYPDYGILCVCIHPGWVKTRRMDADLTVEESTRGIMNVLSTLSEEDNGTFVDWEGRRVPW